MGIEATASIIVLLIVNIAIVSFGMGKLWQKVNTNSDRLTRIEHILDNSPYR